jgi:hypothetical protein
MANTVYEDVCVLHCTDNDKDLTVDVLDFRPQHFLKVSIEKSFALNLAYNKQHDIYVGSLGGREFTTKGPNGRTVNVRRR